MTLSREGGDAVVTTLADDDGRFEFGSLPAGRFTVSAAKPPFVTTSFGASSPGRPGMPIVLAAGDTRRDVVVRLPRGAAITGTVFDTSGQPAPYQYMSLLRRTLTSAGHVLAAVETRAAAYDQGFRGGPTTDDRGVYRFYGLAPGDYVVVVGARPTNGLRDAHQTGPGDLARAMAPPRPASAAGAAMILSVGPPNIPPTDAIAQVPVFFPGTVVASDATPVHVEAGDERAGVDLRIVLSRSGSIVATFRDESGRAPAQGFAHIVGDALPGGLDVAARLFRLEDGPVGNPALMPGKYRIEARATSKDGEGRPVVLWGTTDATINGGDALNLSVTLEPAASVTGRLVFDGGSVGAAPPAIAVSLEPADVLAGSFRTTMTVNADGDRFTFPPVPSGRYRLRAVDRAASSTATRWHLTAANVAGHDVMDVPLDLSRDQPWSDVTVSLTQRAASLYGQFTDASGRPTTDYSVVVFSSDEHSWYWDSPRIRGVHLGSDGSYVADDLPPGDYYVAALADVEPSDWFDPEFLARVRSAAIQVKLVLGARVAQNLKISGR